MSKLPKHLLGLSKGDLESLCVDCGLCCYASVRMDKGQVLVPELRCQHLSVEKSGKSCCSVYEYRHDVAKSWCLPLAEAIEKSVFPSQCPYVADMKDYVGSAVLSDAAYQMVRPQIQKHLSSQVRPGWASDAQWSNFTNLMKSKPYTGPGTRTGSPGNYVYTYDDDDKPKKTRSKKEDVDLWGNISIEQVNEWKKETRAMSKMYRSIEKPGWDASDAEKAKFNEEFEAGRKAFQTFTNNLERWGSQHLLENDASEVTQKALKSAFWALNIESSSMFPTSWDSKDDKYHPNASEMRHQGDKGLKKFQKGIKNALDMAERHIAGKTAAELERNTPTTTVSSRGVNFVIHGKGMDDDYRRAKVDDTIRNFHSVADKFEEYGVGKALDGLTVHVHSQNGKALPPEFSYGGMGDLVAGFYAADSDTLRLLPLGQSDANDTLVHELGHRVYYKLMEPEARKAWRADADGDRIEIKNEHIDSFVDKFVKDNTYDLGDGKKWVDHDKIRAAVAADTSDEQRVYENFAEGMPGYSEGRTVEGMRAHYKKYFTEGEFVNREFVSEYAATNAEELFAEAFKHYIQKGPGSVPPKTRKMLQESFRAAGIPFTKSMRAFLDDMLGQSI